MYNGALFGHLLGVTLLISAVVMTVTALIRAHRASDNAEVASALSIAPVIERMIPPSMLLILGFGLYLTARHGGDNSIPWSAAWLDISITIFAIMGVLGPVVGARRTKQLHEAAVAAGPGPISPEVDRRRRDPLYAHVEFFGLSQLIALLYLMTNKPAAAASLGIVIGLGLVSVVVAQISLRAISSVVTPAPGATAPAATAPGATAPGATVIEDAAAPA